jgi:lysophospholipase L1-like esterase
MPNTLPMTHRILCAHLLSLTMGLLCSAFALAGTLHVGVSATPCDGVPTQPTAAHKASGDWYGNWMKEWLAADWGQRCRYQLENAQLPPTSTRRIVFLGDSITEAWKELVPGFFNSDKLDRGISGQTTEQMLVRFRADVLDLHPAVLHLMAGTNDIAGNRGPTSIAQIEANLQSMVEQARAAHIHVILATIPPAAAFGWSTVVQVPQTIATLNRWIEDYARREHLTYVDYHSVLADSQGALRAVYTEDGVHPNAAGYAAMAPLADRAIAATLRAH